MILDRSALHEASTFVYFSIWQSIFCSQFISKFVFCRPMNILVTDVPHLFRWVILTQFKILAFCPGILGCPLYTVRQFIKQFDNFRKCGSLSLRCYISIKCNTLVAAVCFYDQTHNLECNACIIVGYYVFPCCSHLPWSFDYPHPSLVDSTF